MHAHRGGAAWEQVARFDTFAHPVERPRRTPGARHAAAGHRARVRRQRLATTSATRSAIRQRCDEIHTLATFRGALHAGTWPLGRVARWDADRRRWRQTGRLGDSTEVMALNVYNGKLYSSTIPRAEVFRYERDGSWTSLRRLFDPPGWRPVLVRNMGTPEGFARTREWTRVTSLTQHDGLLFASVGSCTSAAIDAPADVRGTVHAFGTGVVATTPRTLEPGRHHVAAVRRGGALSIYVDGREAATATGAVTGSIAHRRAAARRRGRGRPLRRRHRRLPHLRPGARSRRRRSAPCTTRSE